MSAKKKPRSALLTIGYEGKDAAQVLLELKTNEVDVLLDVRYRPLSRKPGLSKSRLTEACAVAGIKYVHDRELGTPPDQMNHVRESGGYDANARARYRAFLLTKDTALDAAVQLLASARVCLLCFEADASDCHRSIVAEELGKRAKLRPFHL